MLQVRQNQNCYTKNTYFIIFFDKQTVSFGHALFFSHTVYPQVPHGCGRGWPERTMFSGIITSGIFRVSFRLTRCNGTISPTSAVSSSHFDPSGAPATRASTCGWRTRRGWVHADWTGNWGVPRKHELDTNEAGSGTPFRFKKLGPLKPRFPESSIHSRTHRKGVSP